MPFRSSSRRLSRNRLDRYRRTGEPSPSSRPESYGRAAGSATEVFRGALKLWLRENFGSTSSPINFQYKLYRHKIINVTGRFPYIVHNPNRGAGLKGFQMILTVLSVDGLPVKLWPYKDRAYFAVNRIIGREKMFLLPEKSKTYYRCR